MAASDNRKDGKAAEENIETDELQKEAEVARFSPEEEAVSTINPVVENGNGGARSS